MIRRSNRSFRPGLVGLETRIVASADVSAVMERALAQAEIDQAAAEAAWPSTGGGVTGDWGPVVDRPGSPWPSTGGGVTGDWGPLIGNPLLDPSRPNLFTNDPASLPR